MTTLVFWPMRMCLVFWLLGSLVFSLLRLSMVFQLMTSFVVRLMERLVEMRGGVFVLRLPPLIVAASLHLGLNCALLVMAGGLHGPAAGVANRGVVFFNLVW